MFQNLIERRAPGNGGLLIFLLGLTTLVLGLITSLPNIIGAIKELIARGRQTGELSPEQADALTAKAEAAFAKYGSPAPPPEGV